MSYIIHIIYIYIIIIYTVIHIMCCYVLLRSSMAKLTTDEIAAPSAGAARPWGRAPSWAPPPGSAASPRSAPPCDTTRYVGHVGHVKGKNVEKLERYGKILTAYKWGWGKFNEIFWCLLFVWNLWLLSWNYQCHSVVMAVQLCSWHSECAHNLRESSTVKHPYTCHLNLGQSWAKDPVSRTHSGQEGQVQLLSTSHDFMNHTRRRISETSVSTTLLHRFVAAI
jgi:hypothetical protein